MTEAATVYWFHVEANPFTVGDPINNGGRDCKFESLENAVRFVMEELSGGDRASALIQTDSRTIHIADIEKMYAASSPPENESRGD
jgi:hypothetical protein